MTTISKGAGLNFTGIKKLEYVFQDEIFSFRINLSTLLANIVLNAGASWKQIYFTPGSIDHELNKETETNAGTRYDQKILFKEPKITNTLSALLFKMKGRKTILLITDVNQNIYVMGSLDHYVKLSSSGKTTGNYQGYNIEFTCSLPYPLPFVQTWQAMSEEGGEGGTE